MHVSAACYCHAVTAPGKRWVEVDGGDEVATARLAQALSIHPLAARVLATRGLADLASAGRFLSPRLEDLPDPFTMKGMEAAVGRLVRAIESGERIACYGDYDVDGVTSTTLLAGFLRAAGAEVSTYVPHRLSRGTGSMPRPFSGWPGRAFASSSPSTAASPAWPRWPRRRAWAWTWWWWTTTRSPWSFPPRPPS